MSANYNREIPKMAGVVERNVNALLHRKQQDKGERTSTERAVDAICRFAGSMLSVYFHIVLFGVWVIWNLGWLPLKPFDHSFIILATFAAVEAIFLTTFVLISQNRMNLQADKWAELDLQVSLLTEHEVTHVMNLVRAIAKKMDIKVAEDEEIEELSKDIHPEKVLDTMEKASK
ncbi:MAG TPA: DUF1003 domain-containing protein [Chitinophagaceae bacterium]|nr:DUF1003 domain-containing protein [Chitinophagaceae bacterium]